MNMKMRKNIGMAALIIVVIFAVVKGGTSLAYFFADQLHATTYQLAKIDTEIDEEFEKENENLYTKNPKVKNIGSSQAIVRVRIEITPSSQIDNIELIDEDQQSQWIKGEDGYYYYQGILEPEQETDTLFDKVQIKDIDKMEDFDIIIYNEAIQSVAYDKQGNEISALENGQYNQGKALLLWKYYK